MTRIKLCGLMQTEDIETANMLRPDYIGFVFAKKSRRYVLKEQAKRLKEQLSPDIPAVGVFVNEEIDTIVQLLDEKIIDAVQLHGDEDDSYIKKLREFTECPIIKAFQIRTADDIRIAEKSSADHILLDAGKGEGRVFDWALLSDVNRDYFLAGGLTVDNISEAINRLHPFAVDVSSGIETDGKKDPEKMRRFVSCISVKL